jgi:hypothetical protein
MSNIIYSSQIQGKNFMLLFDSASLCRLCFNDRLLMQSSRISYKKLPCKNTREFKKVMF